MVLSLLDKGTERSPFRMFFPFLFVLIFLFPACVTTYERPTPSYKRQPSPHRSVDLRNI